MEIMLNNITSKLILRENDLQQLGILDDYNSLRSTLRMSSHRSDCFLIQGGAFVVQGKAFLLLGTGGIDFLDSLSQLDSVDGIIGNGNALFVSTDFTHVYSVVSRSELVECYELEGSSSAIEFIEDAPIAPLIFLVRSFRTMHECTATRKKLGRLLFDMNNTFAGEPVKFSGSMKSRLRAKFLATARVVHCARRPTLTKKECLFDPVDRVCAAVNFFRGHFALVYTLWSDEMCDVIGMKLTRHLAESYNPTDPITPHFVRIAVRYISNV